MEMASYQAYNITIDDIDPMLVYKPYRDGPSNATWYIALEGGDTQEYYTTSSPGASVELQWTGTAVWLYGLADPYGYQMSSDTNPSPSYTKSSDTANGLLFSQTGLKYGAHWISLNVTGGTVTISSATISVGMGEAGTALQNHSISTVTTTDDNTMINSFFSLSDDDQWMIPTDYDPEFGPWIETSIPSTSASFQLNSSVGFEIYGIMGVNYGQYSVALSPPPPSAINQTVTEYNATLPWVREGSVLHLATGLERTQTYNITVTNVGPAGLALESVVVFDAIPLSSSSSSTASSSGSTAARSSSIAVPSHSTANLSSGSDALSTGGIAGVVVACVLAFLAAAIVLLVFTRMQRRRNQTAEEIEPTDSDIHADAVHYPTDGSHAYRSVASLHREGALDAPSAPSPYTKSYAETPTFAFDEPSRSSIMLDNSEPKPYAMRPEISSPSTSSSPHRTGSEPEPHAVYQEEDAGPVPLTTPPRYDPAWRDTAGLQEDD